MDSLGWMVAFWVNLVGLGQAPPVLLGPQQVERVNRELHGRLVAYIRRPGHDQRMWSPALGQFRDLFVYLPPGYDPGRRYAVALLLHGAGQDEQIFLQAQVQAFDRAMAAGAIPPVIVVAPDGSVKGRASLCRPSSFWTNSRIGDFEDYLLNDVWAFVTDRYPVRPEREAHALIGVSAGGCAAFALAIKHPDRFKVALGLMPLLNIRYVDCQGRYGSPFDPGCFGLREHLNPREPLGRRRLLVLRFGNLYGPLFGKGDDAIAAMAALNPLELMETCDLRPGQLDLFVGYGGRDEFNVAAQVQSFLYFARQREVEVAVRCIADGRHDLATGKRLLPAALEWAAARIPGPTPPEAAPCQPGRPQLP